MVTTQKNYSPTNLGHASKAPCAMTVAQIDQALRDFILQDTTHLRRDAETATSEISRRERNAQMSEFVRHMAGASLIKLDETIADLSQLRDFLHAESERIKKKSPAICSSIHGNRLNRSIVDNIAQLRECDT